MTAEVRALRADIDSLTSELLARYEEVTLLYDLAREMGLVLDIEAASGTALSRSLELIPARLGVVLVRDEAALRLVSSQGEGASDLGLHELAVRAASEVISRGSQITAHAGNALPGAGRVSHSVLAAPLRTSGRNPEAHVGGALVYAGHLGDDHFSAADGDLCSLVAGQLGQGMENARVLTQLWEKERLESDLKAAAGIQRSLLPSRPPQLDGVDLAAECLPAAEVGGDYYDFVTVADGVDLVVADVTGHGLGPGLVMAMTRSVLRAELRRNQSLATALQATNTAMWDDLVATETFITLFAARYEPASRRLHFVNAGHHPAVLRRADGSIGELTSEGLPLGIVPDPPYEVGSVTLGPDDVVVVFSDGVVEASAPDGSPFGRGGLTAALLPYPRTAGQLAEDILRRLSAFRGAQPQDDDVTLMVLRITQPASPKELP